MFWLSKDQSRNLIAAVSVTCQCWLLLCCTLPSEAKLTDQLKCVWHRLLQSSAQCNIGILLKEVSVYLQSACDCYSIHTLFFPHAISLQFSSWVGGKWAGLWDLVSILYLYSFCCCHLAFSLPGYVQNSIPHSIFERK